MTGQQIIKTLRATGFLELILRHDGVRANIGPSQARIMGVMMIMGAAPDTAGAQSPQSEDGHEQFRRPGFGQYGAVLLVVVNREKPNTYQPRQQTGD